VIEEGSTYKRSHLKDIGLKVSGRVFLEQASENEFTNMLTRLLREKRDLFKDPVTITCVNTLCAKLKKLAQVNVITELTEENMILFINGLKCRLLTL
jgi:hypothetical protein